MVRLQRCLSSAGMYHDSQLASMQEEADSRIFLHVKHADDEFRRNNVRGSITIKSADTDVLVLAVHYFPQLRDTAEIWI